MKYKLKEGIFLKVPKLNSNSSQEELAKAVLNNPKLLEKGIIQIIEENAKSIQEKSANTKEVSASKNSRSSKSEKPKSE